MSTFVHTTLEVKGAGLARFVETMSEIVSLMEGWGWKLVGGYVQRTGKLNTVIDVWEVDDFNHFDSVLKKLIAHDRFPAIKAVLDDTVQSEIIVFADKAPYMK